MSRFLFTLLFLSQFISFLNAHANEPVQCAGLYDQFCRNLWDRPNLGNKNVSLSTGRTYNIRFGHERSGVAYADYNYFDAALKAESRFPADLRKALVGVGYFRQLRVLLKPKQNDHFTVKEAQKNNDLIARLNFDLGNALVKVARDRLEARFPGYLKSDEVTPEQSRALDFIVKLIYSEISKTLWQNSPQWADIKKQFDQIKSEYIAWLNEDNGLNPAYRALALQRIRTIKLRIPGSNPLVTENDCALNQKNAYYDPSHHELTVCAGLFGTNILLTVTHEVAHAIDPTTIRTYDLFHSSTFAEATLAYNNLCSDQKLSCDRYANLKNELLNLNPIKKSFFAPEYLQCLGQRELADFPNGRQLSDLSANLANASTERYAQSYFFTFTASENIETDLGHHVKNANFMNPCKQGDDNHETHEFGTDQILLLSFEAEYRCSQEPNVGKKLDLAIASARSLTALVEQDVLASVERDNWIPELVLRNQAKSVSEQAADNIGLIIAARLLKKLDKVEDRRLAFLAGGPLFCDPPGVFRQSPEMAISEKKFSSDGHTIDIVRRKELMTDSIREVLNCESPEQTKSCHL